MKNFSFLISLIVFSSIIFSSCNNKNELQLVSNGVSIYKKSLEVASQPNKAFVKKSRLVNQT